MKELPSQQYLCDVLSYEPDTGVFTWITGKRKGKQAGTKQNTGYISIKINRVQYLAHRLAWMYVHGVDPGDMKVDHLDHNPCNNSINNLRLCSQSTNCHNRTNQGLGITRVTGSSSWQARIDIDGVQRYLGSSPCPLLARMLYEDALV